MAVEARALTGGEPATGWWSAGKALLALAAANLVLGAALFALRPPQRPAPERLPALPPQVEALRAQIAQGRRGEPYTLELADAELTATAAYLAAAAPDVPFGHLRIAVLEGKVVADGVTRGLAVTVPVRVTVALSARDGLPRAMVEDVSLGDTALPGFARDQIIREANKSLDFSRYPLRVTVDALELRPGRMTVRGTVR